MSDPILKRREAALRLMAGTGIWRSNYAPPLVRLAWRLGWDLPLPHYLPAWQVVLGFGGFFGAAFTGLIMSPITYSGASCSTAASRQRAAIPGLAR